MLKMKLGSSEQVVPSVSILGIFFQQSKCWKKEQEPERCNNYITGINKNETVTGFRLLRTLSIAKLILT